MFRLFGREPALWLALLYNIVVVVSAFVFPLTIDQQGTINAVGAGIVGLVTAWVVQRDGLSAAILGMVKAVIALAISFGLHWAPEVQGVVMALVASVVAMFIRTQVTAPVQPTAKDPLS